MHGVRAEIEVRGGAEIAGVRPVRVPTAKEEVAKHRTTRILVLEPGVVVGAGTRQGGMEDALVAERDRHGDRMLAGGAELHQPRPDGPGIIHVEGVELEDAFLFQDQGTLAKLDPRAAFERERQGCEKFYDLVRDRVAASYNAEAKQKIILEFYDKFIRAALPRVADRHGLVFTPVPIVDDILRSADASPSRRMRPA